MYALERHEAVRVVDGRRHIAETAPRLGDKFAAAYLARRQRREATVASRAPAEPLDFSGRADVQETVRAALASLDERQVQLLLLRQEGLSYRELATVLGVAPGSVGTLLARAEAAFERTYRKLGGEA